ncbi:MAG: serine/threonine-protein kinase [Gemmatimonadales bacterium]
MTIKLATVQESLAEHYEVECLLGKGGMSYVYKGRARVNDRDVAIKVFRPEFAITLLRDRFHQEVEILQDLAHPNILPLIESGESEFMVYYVMPFAHDGSLFDRLQRERSLSLAHTIPIVRAVATALDYAHLHDVIHRDVKPENVVFDGDTTMLCDFGVARAMFRSSGDRISTSGLIVGTPHYMSPEQALGLKEIDYRSDIYSLGVVAYEMLAGEPPFTGRNQQTVRRKQIAEHPPSLCVVRPDLPRTVEDVVMRALAKKPEERWESAGEMAEALEKGAGFGVQSAG